ncbi:hypothetical protein Acr_25g0006960 [Actinidia rufa]|uniref:Secreted protein n=1 Tax=Actinidia rufa TaxID=165716 RepID=A0A7J0GZM5_9ERIC|nr:hypothetical protein Acr_25g0006960 [Actinidia rufa]
MQSPDLSLSLLRICIGDVVAAVSNSLGAGREPLRRRRDLCVVRFIGWRIGFRLASTESETAVNMTGKFQISVR